MRLLEITLLLDLLGLATALPAHHSTTASSSHVASSSLSTHTDSSLSTHTDSPLPTHITSSLPTHSTSSLPTHSASSLPTPTGSSRATPSGSSRATPSSSARPTPTGSWQIVSCSDPTIANAAAAPSSRWQAADTDDAWNAAVEAWTGGQSQSGGVSLPFSAFISNFFHGPESWNCQDVGNVPCSTVVQCDQVDHPAGFLILNSFSSVHQVSSTIYIIPLHRHMYIHH